MGYVDCCNCIVSRRINLGNYGRNYSSSYYFGCILPMCIGIGYSYCNYGCDW